MADRPDVGGGGEFLLTYRDVRRRLRISQSTAEKLVKTGQLRSVLIESTPGAGRRLRRFRPEDLAAYLDGRAS